MSAAAGDHDPGLREGVNCWRVARADRLAVIVDADDYFRHARAAMLAARERIILVGWDFDAGIDLGETPGEPGAPRLLGPFMLWLVRRTPGLCVNLLRWDPGVFKPLRRLSNFVMLMRWLRHRQIALRLDANHPLGASHHQKIVVIDDCLAFAGGIDMTRGRWDTPAHDPADARRQATPPWHDATTMIEGPAAAALGELARDRWTAAGGAALRRATPRGSCWPDGVAPQFVDIAVAISRTAPEMPGSPGVHEIEQLYVDLIARARRTIYAESQYFASRRIAEALAARLREAEPPEIVLINPLTAEGWLEPIAMDSARARLVETLRRVDHRARLRLYHPYAADGTPIYVHAKILVIDDTVLRVGSSNMNNRSLRLDTECDVTIDATLAGNAGAAAAIAAVRDGLVAEHLGIGVAEVARQLGGGGSLIELIETRRGAGRSLRPYSVPDIDAVKAWLADNEVLDPEGPGETFEGFARRGLFRRRLVAPAA